MNDYVSLVVVIAFIVGIGLLSRLHVWRTCRCGTQYCTGCGTKRGH